MRKKMRIMMMIMAVTSTQMRATRQGEETSVWERTSERKTERENRRERERRERETE